tara:strand:- start:492 stop:695 length:204 start_codon:yes stop_codon:yes gene_type:complete
VGWVAAFFNAYLARALALRFTRDASFFAASSSGDRGGWFALILTRLSRASRLRLSFWLSELTPSPKS